MPDEDITVKADFNYSEEVYTLTVINGQITTGMFAGTSVGIYSPGVKTSVDSDALSGLIFDHWEADGIELSEYEEVQPELYILMPDNDVTMTAVYESRRLVPHKLSVVNGKFNDGTGRTEGDFHAGSKVKIVAEKKAGLYFAGWTITKGVYAMSETDRMSENFTVFMPYEDVEFTATYSTTPPKPDSGDHNNLLLYGGLAAAAVLGALAVLIIRKKRKL